jgi:hypothetical protein
MFFFRNKHIQCDFGTGNNNKLNWVLEDKQELIDIIETIYRGAKKGRGLVVSPKGQISFPTPFTYPSCLLIIAPRLLYASQILAALVYIYYGAHGQHAEVLPEHSHFRPSVPQ